MNLFVQVQGLQQVMQAKEHCKQPPSQLFHTLVLVSENIIIKDDVFQFYNTFNLHYLIRCVLLQVVP